MNIKKIFKTFIVTITIIFLLSPISFCADVDFKDQIEKEDGSLFEKIIAECIGRYCTDSSGFYNWKRLKCRF